jgi:hypothetical protein
MRRGAPIHELASERRHRMNLAHARRSRQTDSEGSNAVNAGWGDTLLAETTGHGRQHGDGK